LELTIATEKAKPILQPAQPVEAVDEQGAEHRNAR
jgi:hypothetical protein